MSSGTNHDLVQGEYISMATGRIIHKTHDSKNCLTTTATFTVFVGTLGDIMVCIASILQKLSTKSTSSELT